MAADATLLLIERIVGPPTRILEPSSPTSTCWLHLPGRERTLQEWDALVTRAVFRLTTDTPSTSGLGVVEAAPATVD